MTKNKTWEEQFDDFGLMLDRKLKISKLPETGKDLLAYTMTKDFIAYLIKKERVNAVRKVNSEANKRVEDTVKAFGGCLKCYGKGYNTAIVTKEIEIYFCVCNRGKALEKLWK